MSESRPVHVVGGCIIEGSRCLVARRGPSMALSGKWEFPGGKVEPGERATAALARELQEELGIRAEIGSWLGRGDVRSTTGGRLVLDVYAATIRDSAIHLREHAETRWVDAEELDDLDWADADVPVLPAVRAHLRAEAGAQCCGQTPVFVCADWAGRARKRTVCVARRSRRWSIRREAPPAAGWTLEGLIALARELNRWDGAPVLVGIDAVLGLPAAFARGLGERSFLDALARLETNDALADDAESRSADAWRPERPFFRVPLGSGGLTRFLDAAGGRTGMLRQIELRTGAKPVFAVSGIPGTVGSGSRALWRELAPRLRDPERPFRVWPFEGDLRTLTDSRGIALAEVYPRAAYGVALAPDLPASPRQLAKTDEGVRERVLRELEAADWIARAGVALQDVEAARASEDDFDALLTAVALARLVEDGRPLSDDLVDPVTEGGILGTGATVLRASDRRLGVAARGVDTENRSEG